MAYCGAVLWGGPQRPEYTNRAESQFSRTIPHPNPLLWQMKTPLRKEPFPGSIFGPTDAIRFQYLLNPAMRAEKGTQARPWWRFDGNHVAQRFGYFDYYTLVRREVRPAPRLIVGRLTNGRKKQTRAVSEWPVAPSKRPLSQGHG